MSQRLTRSIGRANHPKPRVALPRQSIQEGGDALMTNLNHVTVTGYLARDPVLLGTPAGHTACKLIVASNRTWQNILTGAWEQRVDYLDAFIFSALGAAAHEHLSKGCGVGISGRLYGRRISCSDPEHSNQVVILVQEIQFHPKTSDSRLWDPDRADQPAAGEDPLDLIDMSPVSTQPIPSP
jgi:single stranded DNA-binding protein